MSEDAPAPNGGEFLLYPADDGEPIVHLRAKDGSVWLTQAQLATLYQVSKQSISSHIKSILESEEITSDATVKEYLTVETEMRREVERLIKHYALPMILAVGYRVRSQRGTQFRQWATRHLTEYLTKGFVIDDQRLKDPKGFDYFDELLERIRDIRASEKRFYRKVRDLFALSSDYKSSDQDASIFFAEVQNKLIYAVTQKTAAELIVARADADQPNMALTNWKGTKVRKGDVVIAKNYLSSDEIDTLNRLVTVFLETAELRVKDRKDLTLAYWRANVVRLLEFQERPILTGAGRVSREQMEELAQQRFGDFDAQRRSAELEADEADDLRELEELEQEFKKRKEQDDQGT